MSKKETKAEETKAEDVKTEETKTEEVKVEETKTEEVKAEESKTKTKPKAKTKTKTKPKAKPKAKPKKEVEEVKETVGMDKAKFEKLITEFEGNYQILQNGVVIANYSPYLQITLEDKSFRLFNKRFSYAGVTIEKRK